MQSAELIVTATLCFESRIFAFQLIIHMPKNKPEMSGFWCVTKAWLF